MRRYAAIALLVVGLSSAGVPAASAAMQAATCTGGKCCLDTVSNGCLCVDLDTPVGRYTPCILG